LISVVIPVMNGDHWLGDTIPAILNQQVKGSIEIITIDSGSTDKTLSILSSYPVRLIQIKQEEFNHGLTRNLGAWNAKGKFIVMTVQDARPLSPLWLQELLNGFTDETVASVCGQQVVTHDLDKNPAEWYGPISKPELRKYHFPDKEVFLGLSPAEQLAICRWDDVNAMYRSEILMQLPFRQTDFAEDVLWAKDALMAGQAIVYNPFAQVAHYHHEDYGYAFRRNFIVQYHFYKYFGVVPKKYIPLRRYLSIVKLLLKEKRISYIDKIKWLKYNYQSLRAIANSNTLILETLTNKGEKQLDEVYRKAENKIPQALKRSPEPGIN